MNNKNIIIGVFMWKSGKYIGIVIGILIFIVLVYACLFVGGSSQDLSDNSGNLTNVSAINGTYSVGNVSFKCPDNWSVETDNEDESTIRITASPIYSSNNFTSFGPFPVRTVTTTSPDDAQFEVQISNDSISKQLVTQIENVKLDHNMKKISSGTLTIDGEKAYEMIFTTNYGSDIGIMRDEQIGFVKNGIAYVMDFEAKDGDFDKEKQKFDIILNSFKVL